MAQSTPEELLQQGKLTEAKERALEIVKKKPGDHSARGMLAQILCFTGELERADKQLEIVGQQEVSAMYAMTAMRRLIKAETARQACFLEGNMPEVLGQKTPQVEAHGRALAAAAKKNWAEAAEILSEAQSSVQPHPGKCNDTPFADFRDMDDLCATILEVITLSGEYAWVSLDQVAFFDMKDVRNPIDQIWRTANLGVADGPEGDVFLPCLYPRTTEQLDDQLRTGKGTDWLEEEAGIVRGAGQRMFACGETDVAIFEIKKLQFDNVSTKPAESEDVAQ